MGRTANKSDLLQSCIQDLHAARCVVVERLPGVAAQAGETLAALLRDLQRQYAAEAKQFESLDISLDGPANLWMAGVLDDAERDTRTVEPGPLLDTALIGAVRKGVAADVVSLETAVAVARALSQPDIAASVQTMHAAGEAADERLRGLLHEIA